MPKIASNGGSLLRAQVAGTPVAQAAQAPSLPKGPVAMAAPATPAPPAPIAPPTPGRPAAPAAPPTNFNSLQASQGVTAGQNGASDINTYGAQYGGVPGGAEAFNGYTSGLAASAAKQQAPNMDLASTNAARSQAMQGLGAQQQGLGALQTQAQGGGPGATAAQAGFNTSANSGMLAALQASGAGRGAAQQSAAGLGAIAQNAGAANAAAGQAGSGLAQSAMAGQQAYQQGAQGLSANAQTLQNQDWGTSMNQANLALQQGQIDVNGAQGFLGLGQNALASQGQADASRYGADVGNETAANQIATQTAMNNIGLGLGAVTSAASALGSYQSGQSNQKNQPNQSSGGL